MIIQENNGIARKGKPYAEIIPIEPELIPINIDEFIFDLSKPLPPEEIVISVQGKIVGTTHNICVITGKPKSRKSVIAHAIIGSALCGVSTLGFECNVNSNDVVLIDTEQGKHDLFRSLTRMQKLNNMNVIPKNLKVYAVRSLTSEQIIHGISKILEINKNLKLLIIDGGLDLINNMNDVIESKRIIDFFKIILDEYNICVVLILHQSKSTNFTIGHFGSFMDRFGQSIIQVAKEKDGSGTVSSVMMRSNEDFKSYSFYYNHQVDNYTVGYLEKKELSVRIPSDLSIDEHMLKLQKIYAYKDAFLHKDLLIVCNLEYQKTQNWCKDLIKYLFDKNILEKTEAGIILKDGN
jgi:hypothetical protein